MSKSTGKLNYGIAPSCEIGETIHMVIANELKKDGSKNCVSINDNLDQAQFDGLFKNQDADDRWMLIEGVTKVSPIANDDITDTSDPRITRSLAKGIRGVVFSVVTEEPAKLAKSFEANKCGSQVLYRITDCGQLVGVCSGEDLCGRKIARISTLVVDKSAQNGTASELTVTIEFKPTQLDSDVDYIETASDEDLTDRSPLIDVTISNVVASTTGITFDLNTINGAKNSRKPATGLASDLEIYNATDDVVETLTGSITETADGKYSATYAVAVDVNDGMVVRGTSSETVKSIYDIKRVDDVETATV